MGGSGPETSRPLDRGPALRHPARDQNAAVQFRKLNNAEGFVLVDLDGAERASGVVRLARKVLRDSAVTLARHLTYAYAILQVQASGASAGLNSEPDERAATLKGFVAEVASGSVSFDPGKGVTAADLAPLAASDTRRPATDAERAELSAASMFAALAAVRDLDGLVVASEVALPEPFTTRLTASGATLQAVPAGTLDAPCEVLVVGSRMGLIDHENVGEVQASVILPAAPLPVTTRGLATATRRGIDVLPDFVALAGPLIGHWPADGATLEALRSAVTGRVTEVLRGVAGHPDGAFLGAAQEAEDFLSSWRDELPFGRPIP